MKIAILADMHMGCRKNSRYFMNQQQTFFDNKFFPYLKENNITTVIHAGDFFDNRKSVNFETLQHAKDVFIDPIINNGIDLHMIVGNHDSYYKSNGDLTSIKLLYNDIPNITIYDSLTHIKFDNKDFMMIPWIFPIQKDEYTEKIRLSVCDVCVCHAEMAGVVYQGNTISRKGMDTDTFTHIPHVFSGHFHKKSQYYVGSPYQMSWSDYDDPKRIIVYDTETNDTEDVYINDDIYVKIEYPYMLPPNCHEIFHDKIVRVIVRSKESPAEFDKFIELLEDCDPYEIDIKDEYLYIDVLDSDEIDDDTDTLSVLTNSIDAIDDLSKGDRMVIKEIMRKLYEKAGEK